MLRTMVFALPICVSTVVMAERCPAHSAVTLHGIILPQRMAFPIVRHQDAAKVRMPLEANSEEIEILAFVPICSGPNQGYRRDCGVASAQAHFQANALAPAERKQMVVHFEARLDGKAVQSGDVREKRKPQ